MQELPSDVGSLDTAWSGLMAAAQAGDKVAYARLLRECTPLIRRVVRRGMRPDRIDDAVQDVLLTIHRARHTYDPTRSFSAWIATIAQRRAIDLLRQRGRHDRREVHAPFEYEAFPSPEADRDATEEQRGRILDAALASLPRANVKPSTRSRCGSFRWRRQPWRRGRARAPSRSTCTAP